MMTAASGLGQSPDGRSFALPSSHATGTSNGPPLSEHRANVTAAAEINAAASTLARRARFVIGPGRVVKGAAEARFRTKRYVNGPALAHAAVAKLFGLAFLAVLHFHFEEIGGLLVIDRHFYLRVVGLQADFVLSRLF